MNIKGYGTYEPQTSYYTKINLQNTERRAATTDLEHQQNRKEQMDTYIMSEEARNLQLIQVDGVENLEDLEDSIITDEEIPKYELSDSDRDKLQKQYSKLSENWVMRDMLLKTAESNKAQAQAEAERIKEETETLQKCMKISRNMGKGLKTPPMDEKYLMKKNINMYQMAVNARNLVERLNKEAESELDKEDIKELRGDASLSKQIEKNASSNINDNANSEKYAEISIMNAIGKVLDGDAPLESLEGIIPLKSFEGVKVSGSFGGDGVAQGGSVSFDLGSDKN